MMTSARRRFLNVPFLVAPLAFVALTACGPRDDDRTAGQKLDSAIATTEQKTDQARADASQQLDEAKQAARDTGRDLREDATAAGDKVMSSVSDAAISTAVKAELAKDSKLSATKIDVDTHDGYVRLRGTAPDGPSLDRATMLAASVKGVVKVDNQLSIAPGG